MLSGIALLLCHIYILSWTLTLNLKSHTVSIKLKNSRPNVQSTSIFVQTGFKTNVLICMVADVIWYMSSFQKGTNENVALLAYKEVAKYDAPLHENTNLCFSKLTHPVSKESCTFLWDLHADYHVFTCIMLMSSWTSYQLDWLSKLHGTINEQV